MPITRRQTLELRDRAALKKDVRDPEPIVAAERKRVNWNNPLTNTRRFRTPWPDIHAGEQDDGDGHEVSQRYLMNEHERLRRRDSDARNKWEWIMADNIKGHDALRRHLNERRDPEDKNDPDEEDELDDLPDAAMIKYPKHSDAPQQPVKLTDQQINELIFFGKVLTVDWE